MPNSGTSVGGTLIEISGTGFFGEVDIRVDGVSCSDIQVVNSARLTAVTPPGEGDSDVVGFRAIGDANVS